MEKCQSPPSGPMWAPRLHSTPAVPSVGATEPGIVAVLSTWAADGGLPTGAPKTLGRRSGWLCWPLLELSSEMRVAQMSCALSPTGLIISNNIKDNLPSDVASKG